MSYNPGDVLKERYVIKEVLGKGSMGEVYRAEHVTIHRTFAIKLMHVHIAEKSDALARFQREANAAAQLDHPHICQVTDFDSTDNDDFYLVMEYLKGETLRERLEREETIELKSIFRIMNDLLSALECAHSAGIVHRDIKPENISLINRDDRNDYVKLIDFGIAHADKPDDEHGTLTQSGQVYGTPQYLSPEQVMGNPVDLRADLYSCGCLLFEMIEGEPPFNCDNYILLLNKHLVVDPPHLTKEFDCAQELDEVIQKLLKKHPEDRYSSAREVRTVLSDIANRYIPELNLRMSQSGDASSSLAGLQSPSSDSHPKTTKTQNGSSSISNPYINPDEVSIPQSPNGGKEEAPQKKTRVSEIAIASGIVLILLAAALLNMFWNQRKSNDADTPTSADLSMGIPDMDPSNIIDGDIKLSDDAIREYASSECTILKNDPLYHDETIKNAANACLHSDFDTAYKSLDKVKSSYHQNIHFNIMMMINAYALNKFDVVVRNFLKIIDTDPAAVCNPAVRDIGYSLFENDAAFQDLQYGLNLLDPSNSSESLSWLLLLTPCNHHQKRFDRLASCFDKVDEEEENLPPDASWLEDAVNIWRPFRIRGACQIRQRRLDPIVLQGLKTACTHPDGSLVIDNAQCSQCYDIWLERESKQQPAQPQRVAFPAPPSILVQPEQAPAVYGAQPEQGPAPVVPQPEQAPAPVAPQPEQAPAANPDQPVNPPANPALAANPEQPADPPPSPAPSVDPPQPVMME